MTMESPPDRCGFVLTEEDASRDYLTDRQLVSGPYYDCSCCRETWNDSDYCVWHTKTSEKSVEELIEARTDYPERFDGAYVSGLYIDNQISFKNCTLHSAVFDGARLEGTDFEGIEAIEASFKHSDSSHSIFRDSLLIGCDFSDSNMQIISARGASIVDCDFSKTHVDGDLRDVDMMDTNFSQAEKGPGDFTGARVHNVDFSQSVMYGWKFQFVDGYGNDFSDCAIWDSEISYSGMEASDFTRSELSDVTIISSNLERSEFSGSNITSSDFRETDLYGCLFQNTQLDRASRFGSHYLKTERPPIRASDITELNPLWEGKVNNWGGENRKHLLEKRIWTLQAIEDLLTANSQGNRARDVYIKRKNSQRKLKSLSGKWTNVSWIFSLASALVMGYGEKPFRVISSSIVTIFIFSLVFYYTGGVISEEFPPIISKANICLFDQNVYRYVNEYLTSLYFSGMTFSSLGYGDLQPATWEVRAFATVESFLGALFMALLVFVLGRRTTR